MNIGIKHTWKKKIMKMKNRTWSSFILAAPFLVIMIFEILNVFGEYFWGNTLSKLFNAKFIEHSWTQE